MRRLLLIGLVVSLATPAAAGAATVETEVSSRGGLTVSWAGETARGCAGLGACDVSGALSVRLDGTSSGTATGPSRSLRDEIDVSGQGGVVRVLRGDPDRPVGACVDRIDDTELMLEARRLAGGRTRLRLRAASFEPSGLSAGRCAGPLPEDVAAALPSTEVATARLGSGRPVDLDLRGSSAFAAGPYAGTVASTLRVRVTRRLRRERSGREVSRPVPARSPARRRPRVVLLQLDFRATVQGALRTAFSGGAACEPLDICGLRGIHELTPAPGRALRLRLFGYGPASALRTRTVAGALDAVGAGRLDLFGGDSDLLRARATATVERPGGAACHDERPLELPPLAAEQRLGSVRLGLGGRSFGEPVDLLRTRCTGPTRGDAAGNGPLAFADLPATALARRSQVVALRQARPPGGPFAIAPRGDLAVRLELVRSRLRFARGSR